MVNSARKFFHRAFIRFRTHLSPPQLPSAPHTRRKHQQAPDPSGAMTFSNNPDADPDPTTQMTWPSSRRSASGSHILKSNYPGGRIESPQVERGPLRLDPTAPGVKTLVYPSPKRLTTKDLIYLSISMAGAQIAWTVELGYVFHTVLSCASYVAFCCRCFAVSSVRLRSLRIDMGHLSC